MKKLLVLLAAVMMLVPVALAGEVIVIGPIGGGAGTSNTEPILLDYDTTYPYDGSPAGRNSFYPGYEFAWDGNTVHLWALVWDTTIYDVENMEVHVVGTCSGVGSIDVPLTLVSPSSPIGGGYQAQYAGDYIVGDVATVQGNCDLDVVMTDPQLGVGIDLLTDPLYENVNDLLLNPLVTLTPTGSLSFSAMVVNAWTNADTYPISLALTSDLDTEGQGVIGDLEIGVTPLYGDNFPGDIICADDIRMRTGTSGVWTPFPSQCTVGVVSYQMIGSDIDTDGAGYSEDFYFQIFYDATHTDWSFSGGDLWMRYSLY